LSFGLPFGPNVGPMGPFGGGPTSPFQFGVAGQQPMPHPPIGNAGTPGWQNALNTWGPAVAGGLFGLLGQSSTNRANRNLAREQMGFQAGQSAAQMAFQERMSSTAHQREVADLKAAGLNPMLATMRAGATTPPGAMGQGQTATMQNAAAQGLASAMAVRKMKEELKLMKAEVYRTTAEGYFAEQKAKTDIDVRDPTVQKLKAESENLKAHAHQLRELTPAIKRHLGAQAAREYEQALQATSTSDVLKVEKTLLELQVKKAQNLSKAEESAWKRNVAPYLSDARTAAQIVGTAAGGAAAGGMLRAFSREPARRAIGFGR
jgi:hypothetical protein